jgi:hypothetical protein
VLLQLINELLQLGLEMLRRGFRRFFSCFLSNFLSLASR